MKSTERLTRGLQYLTLAALATMSAACEHKSEIKPLFEKKKLTEIHGDGKAMTVNVKIPLTQATVGSYDASELLEDESLDEKKHGILRKFWNGIKYRLYDTAIDMGISNRIKYSFDYEFPEIDSKYIKSVRVNKIFFALENCSPEDEHCILRSKERPVTFNFLDQFFMNISNVEPGMASSLEEQDMMIDKEVFENAAEKAFSSDSRQFYSYLDESAYGQNPYFRDVNVARFSNSRSYRKNKEVARELSKVYLLRLSRHMSKGEKIDLVRHFESDAYAGVVRDFTLIGHNIYLELETPESREQFFTTLNEKAGSVEELGVVSFESCSQENCANLNTNNYNLVPVFERGNTIRFDTYLSLEMVEKSDFRYNGFVELEVKLDLGI